MPLHVDRTSVHVNQQQLREHVMDRTSERAARPVAASGGSGGQDESGAVVRIARLSPSQHADVASVQDAERLVQQLISSKGSAAAHGTLDPARVTGLLAD